MRVSQVGIDQPNVPITPAVRMRLAATPRDGNRVPVLRPSHVRRLMTWGVVLGLLAAGWWFVHSPLWGEGTKTYAEPWSTDGAGTQPPSISPDGTEVTVHFMGGGCFKSASARADEATDTVTITVQVTDYADPACSAIGVYKSATVSLEEPVGDRRLVDGAVD